MDIIENISSQEYWRHLKTKGFSEEELAMIMLAYRLAKSGHHDQVRDDGTRYFNHPKTLVLIAVDEVGITDASMLVALELHDIPEDTFLLTLEDIERIFGKEVRRIVEALSKYKVVYSDGRIIKELKDNFHGSFAEEDEKARTAKLIDRLHNIRTLDNCTLTKQRRYIKETEEVYLPLAWKTDKNIYKLLAQACNKIKVRL